jgi:hypothetical protein
MSNNHVDIHLRNSNHKHVAMNRAYQRSRTNVHNIMFIQI